MVSRSRSSDPGTGALTREARSSWNWYWFEALQVTRVRSGEALAIDDVHPASVGAEGHVVWLVGGRDQAGDPVGALAPQRDDRDRVRARVDGVEALPVARQRHREGGGAGVAGAAAPAVVILIFAVVLVGSGEDAGGSARIDLGDHRVARGVDHGDLVGVVLRHEQLRARGVERHAHAVAVELDALDQAPGGPGADVDHDHFTVAVRGDVGGPVAFDHHREGEGAADAAAHALVAREEGAQVVLVPDRAARRVNHADRVVVVVGDHQRGAVSGDAEAAGVGADAHAHSPVRMAQADGADARPGAAGLRVDVHGIVPAAGGVELAVR